MRMILILFIVWGLRSEYKKYKGRDKDLWRTLFSLRNCGFCGFIIPRGDGRTGSADEGGG